MARTKDVVLAPEQTELMEKKYLDFVKPSTYGNKANPSSCNSLYDDVENPELRAIVEKVAATTPYREETSTNEAQSPPNPQKRTDKNHIFFAKFSMHSLRSLPDNKNLYIP